MVLLTTCRLETNIMQIRGVQLSLCCTRGSNICQGSNMVSIFKLGTCPGKLISKDFQIFPACIVLIQISKHIDIQLSINGHMNIKSWKTFKCFLHVLFWYRFQNISIYMYIYNHQYMDIWASNHELQCFYCLSLIQVISIDIKVNMCVPRGDKLLLASYHTLAEKFPVFQNWMLVLQPPGLLYMDTRIHLDMCMTACSVLSPC